MGRGCISNSAPVENQALRLAVRWTTVSIYKRTIIQYEMTPAPGISLGSNWGSQVGWNDGTINNAIHLLPERPETPPTPFESIPFERDPDFVHRGDILDQIERRCAEPPHRAALVGLGGVGKSQIAIQYAHQVRQQFPEMYVFWVHASTQARFKEAYRGIANALRLPRRHDPKTNVLRLVCDWLSRPQNGQWLLILDNADTVDIFYPKSAADQATTTSSVPQVLASFLPQCSNGRIVVTSRSRDAAQQLTGSHWNILPVKAMDSEQAKQLLKNKLRDRYEEEVATSLAHALECMPLAITHAAAYILRAPHMSPTAYLAAFQTSDNARASLLNKDIGDLRRDESAANSVVITWQITFERIRRERPSAADLLSLMSFFNPQGIPKWVLQRYRQWPSSGITIPSSQSLPQKPKKAILKRIFQSYQHRHKRGRDISHSVENQGGTGNDEFDDDMEVLHGYSLVGLTTEEDAYDMHALVQFCTRVWLSSTNDIKRWSHTFLRLMATEFPPGTYENLIRCQQLSPHIQAILETYPQAKETAEDLVHLLTKTGLHSWQIGMYKVAERRVRKSMDIEVKFLGKRHPDVLNLDILSIILHSEGKYDEAEKIIRLILRYSQKGWGRDHPNTLRRGSHLATILRDRGKYSEAEKIQQCVLDRCEKTLGKEHLHTFMYAGMLAAILESQGKYDNAEQIQRRGLDGLEKALGEGHPQTLANLFRLSKILLLQGKYDEAEQIQRRAGNGYEKTYGSDHPHTIHKSSILALVLQCQGKYDEAEKIQRRVLNSYEKALGEEHPETFMSASILASILRCQGNYNEAEQIQRRALDGHEKALGKEHPETLMSLSNLASILECQGKLEEAEERERRALDGREKALGETIRILLKTFAGLH